MSLEYPGRFDRSLLLYASLIILSLFLYPATVARFIALWQEDGYSHGFLLLAICTYIFIREWKSLKYHLPIKPCVSGLVLLAGISMIWAFAGITLIEKIELLSFLLIWPAMLLSVFGWKTAGKLLFPFFLLLFAAPVMELFNDFLRKATAVLSGIALDASGLTIFVDGFVMQIPVGTFEVDTGCSGIRVTTVGIILSLLYAYMNHLSIKQAGFVVTMGVLFAFLSNIVRVYIIVLAGHLTNMRHRLIDDHADLGWFVFAVMMILYFYLLHRHFSRRLPQDGDTVAKQDDDTGSARPVDKTRLIAAILLCLFAMGSGPATAYYVARAGNMRSLQHIDLPRYIAGMTLSGYIADDWEPEYRAGKGHRLERATYIQDDIKVHLQVRYFFTQSRNNEAINVNNRVYPRGVWSEVSSKVFHKTDSERLPFPVEETIISKGDARRMLIWRWYESAERQTGDSRIAKLNNLLATLAGDPSVVVYICAVKQDRDVAVLRDRLRLFIENLDKKRIR